MIGSLNPADKKVVVVGAGISGLLIAYTLKKRGFEVSILEANERVGGLISTEKNAFGLVERAAHSLLVTPEAKTFFDELGIELCPVNKDSRARYIYRDGKMRKIPLRFIEIIQTIITVFSKPKTIFSASTDSLEAWGNTYLGPAATKYLLAPFVSGIFATAPKELLASLAFPKLIPSFPKYSLVKHLRSGKKNIRPQMMAPKNGMGCLILALERELKENIQTGVSVTDLPEAANLILTVPTASLSKLIRNEDSVSAENLLKIKYAPLITATCFFHEKSFEKKPRGVGVLIPKGEGLRLLGCLFNSSSFPERTNDPAMISLTVMLGGTEDREILSLGGDEIRSLINEELKVLLGSQAPALQIDLTRWERAIPIYSSTLKEAQESLKAGFCGPKGRIVFANFSKEVSIRGLINAMLQL